MPNNPAKFLPFYFTVAVVFLSLPGFCAQSESPIVMYKEARAYRQQGWELQTKGDIEGALSCYQKAIMLDPNYAIAYNDVGVILETLGQPEQAKQIYLKALEAAPDYPNTYSNLALLYEDQKDYTNAVICWVKRAVLGQSWDPWTKAARKRLEDIARIYPEAFQAIGEQYKENLQQLEDTDKVSSEGLGVLRPEEPQEISLFSEDAAQKPDNKERALQHLALAKQNFASGQYVVALKEATVAEYLDSSNKEISSFVDEVRRKLLK